MRNDASADFLAFRSGVATHLLRPVRDWCLDTIQTGVIPLVVRSQRLTSSHLSFFRRSVQENVIELNRPL